MQLNTIDGSRRLIYVFQENFTEITLEDVLEAGHRLIDNGDLVDLIFQLKDD